MKKVFKVSASLLSAFLAFTVASCSSTEEFEIVSFKADKTSYSIGETVDFTLTLNNPNNYTVDAAVINGKSYTVERYGASTKTYKVSDKDLTYERDQYRFTLSKIVYTVNGEQKELSVKNQSLVLSETADVTEDLSVESIDIKSLTNPKSSSIYQQDEVEATIKISRKSNVKITCFYFTLTDTTGNVKEVKKSYIDDGKSDFYKVNFIMPAMCDKTEVKLSDVDYVKGTVKKEMNLGFKTNCNVLIQPLSLDYVRISKKSGFAVDVNELSYFDSSSVIDITIKLDNPSLVQVTGLTICGHFFSCDAKNDVLQKTVTINKQLNLNSIETSPTKLTLDKINYENEDGNTLSMNAELSEDIYFYDKIIASSKDLASIKADKDGVITGNYILNSDITISPEDASSPFFKNYVFAGKLEGNGHKIICSSTTRSLFKSVGKDAIIQNVNLNISSTNSEILCEENLGTIRNIKLAGSITQSSDSTNAIFCLSNKGEINNLEFLTMLEGSVSTFKIIEKNEGLYSNVIVNPQSVKPGLNVFIPMPSINSGEVSNVVLSLNKWFTGITAADVKSQNVITIIKTDEGIYKNIILNNNFINQIDTFNKVIKGPEAENPGLFFDLVDEFNNMAFGGIKFSDLFKEAPELFSYETYLLGKTYSTDDYSSYRATIVNNNGFDMQYYSTLGFRTYNTSNNSFWKLSGTTLTLD